MKALKMRQGPQVEGEDKIPAARLFRFSSLFIVFVIAASAVLVQAQAPVIQRSAPEATENGVREQIQCTIPVAPGGRLTLRANAGSIHISPGADNEVRCLIDLFSYNHNPQRAARCLQRYKVKAERVGNGALIETVAGCPNGPGPVSARLEVNVPLKFNVDVKTQGGNIAVERLNGEVRADTAGGDIRAGDVLGPVWVSTAGGVISLGNVGESVFAHSAGGGIRIGNVNGGATLDTSGGGIMTGVVNGPVTAHTAGGDILMQAASGPVVVETAGGQIRLGECGNTVQASTAGGNIEVGGSRGDVRAQSSGGNITLLKLMGPVNAETTAGRILAQIAASRHTFGPSRLQTQVGDVDVFIPPALPVTVKAVINLAMGHRIVSDFPFTAPSNDRRAAFGPETVRLLLNGGGSALNIQASMGNIQIRRLDPSAAVALGDFQQEFWKNWSFQWNDVSQQQKEMFRQMQVIQRQVEQQRVILDRQLRQLDRALRERSRVPVEQLQPQAPTPPSQPAPPQPPSI